MKINYLPNLVTTSFIKMICIHFFLMLSSCLLYTKCFADFPVSVSVTVPKCPGRADGTATITTLGGVAPYTYTLDQVTWQSSNFFTGIGEVVGLQVIVEDAMGDYGIGEITTGIAPDIIANYTITPPSCLGLNDGTITFNSTNQSLYAPFTIDAGVNYPNSIITTLPGTMQNIGPDVLYIQIHDITGCSTTIFIEMPAGDSMNTNLAMIPPTCSNSNDGTLAFHFDAGNPPFNVFDSEHGTVITSDGTLNDIITGYAPGLYHFFVQDDAGCTGKLITAVIPQGPQVDVPLITLINPRLSVANPQNGSNYTWQQLNGGTWNDIGTGTSYTAISSGEYRVKASIASCEVYSSSVAAGRMPSNNPFGFYAYPNPATTTVRIDELKLADGWQTLQIINAQGRNSLPVINVSNQTQVALNIASLPSGIYIIRLTAGDGKTTSTRFIKQ